MGLLTNFEQDASLNKYILVSAYVPGNYIDGRTPCFPYSNSFHSQGSGRYCVPAATSGWGAILWLLLDAASMINGWT
jgi:hypothetical protein